MSPPESTTAAVEKTIRQRKSTDLTGHHHVMDRYLVAGDEVQKSTSAAALSSSSSALLEFRNILLSHASPQLDSEWLTESTHPEFESPGFDSQEEVADGSSDKQFEHRESNAGIREEVDLIPADAVRDLRRIAERMAAAGHLRECIYVYASARSSAVDASLKELGVEKSDTGDVHRLEWETLEKQIRRWTRAARICVRVLFAGERRLCEHIFQGLGDSAEVTCFMETIKSPAIHLFSFADAISTSNQSPEKLFKILDLHDALSNLTPDIEAIFDSESCESIRLKSAEIVSNLADAARGVISEFENAILLEPSKTPVPGGTIHPLTRYVMNYISLISDYKKTLIELIVSKPSAGSGDPAVLDTDLSEYENQSSCLALHLIWIIAILQFNLENKSKHYKDASLSHLFMMNNVHYIVQKIKGSPELREMIGDGYLRKLNGIFRSAATNYQRGTLVRVLYCLRDEGLHMSGSFSSGASRSALRERFKAFNAMFEEVHRTQATWLVPDNQLREELRISISERIIPAYRSFLGRFRIPIERGKHPENYIKYSVEDLENAVLDFFEGYSVSQHLQRRRSE
ncbi:hypothetical protein ABFS83_04G090700 [Erythranthe nasuta]